VEQRNIYDVKQNEYFIWLKQDRHTQAYNVLLTEKSKRIARNMKIKGKASESALCLDCHALNTPRSAQVRPIDVAEGVSCEACHGPSGGWIGRHTEEGWTHEMSVKEGMKDLRNLASRAETCLSCHLGDKRKTVNHELIAAGHPDLIFELDNYSAVMPAHWTPYTDRRKKEGMEDTPGARVWAVGQAVAFQEGMLQVARRARSDNWPEFAEMNCYACHHSLRDSEWRQVRGYKFKAGFPHWNPARYAVLRQLISTFAPQERARLDGQVERLSEAIAKLNTPPPTVAAVATDLADTMGRVIPRLRQADVDDAAARKLIDGIAGDVPYLVDSEVQSVEQAILAINALVTAMGRSNPAIAQGPANRVIDKLYADVKDREGFNRQAFAQHVAELRRLIR
jgi:nitrate/TMAO reductase-like tetraheme cytochrome c subunit